MRRIQAFILLSDKIRATQRHHNERPRYRARYKKRCWRHHRRRTCHLSRHQRRRRLHHWTGLISWSDCIKGDDRLASGVDDLVLCLSRRHFLHQSPRHLVFVSSPFLVCATSIPLLVIDQVWLTSVLSPIGRKLSIVTKLKLADRLIYRYHRPFSIYHRLPLSNYILPLFCAI